MVGTRSPYRIATAILLTLASASAAQVPEETLCTVSILNQSAYVRADGSWTIPNVPSNMGPVRARMTCVENGQVRSGMSDFFTIQTNRMSAIPPIPLGVVAPAPARLSVAAPSATLTSLGETVQLSVTATYPDGSTGSVTAASTGTVYTSTNPRVATVGPNGLVTAVGSGPVLVTALNEAVLAAVLINVSVTGDTDGDGIPDDVELANGLDPNNPLDSLEDLDADGLTNRQELTAFGTGIRDADSDDDTIQDGEEVAAGADGFVTNPLVPDTDGDGVRDALEIATGSDPTNPGSYDLSRALQSIAVSPAAVTLTVNTIIGEASRQLTVTGNLLDGTTIDLTSIGRGTGYASSDLTICNFGATAGRVFAGNDGACTVTATNAGFSAQTAITVRTFAPTALSCLSMPGFANNVDVSGNRAYVSSGAAGLVVVAVDNRQSPSILATLNTAGNANDVRVEGNRAYVADGSNGLLVVNVTNPASPQLLGSVDTPGDAQDVVVRGNLAYVADGASGLHIVDVGNPAAPRILGTYALPAGQSVKGVDVDQSLAALATSSGLWLLDVSSPLNPALFGQVSTGQPRDVALNGDVAYVADYSNGFVTVSISNPAAPVVLAQIPSQNDGLLFDVGLANGFAFGADVFFVHGVPIIDVRVPETPIARTILNFSQFGDRDGTGIALDSNHVYLTASFGIIENGTSGSTQLCIGKYMDQEDDQGIPPTARITSPAAGTTVTEGQPLSVTVDAVDDIAVLKVELLVDGAVVFTDSAPPYRHTLSVPAGNPTLTLGAIATDMGNRVGTAADVILSVVPDPLTSVAGRVVDEAGAPVGGAAVTAIAGAASVSGTTAADGTFFLTGMATVQGAIAVEASAVVGGQNLLGASLHKSPVPGGLTNMGDVTVSSRGCLPCGEASCEPVVDDYISHFTGLDCTGEEHYYTPYFNFDGIRRSWDGNGCVGTILRTVTNRSWRYHLDGQCRNDWPAGNTLTNFVKIYR